MTHVLVLAGGDSSEREVSLRSGAAVAAALEAGGFIVSQFDPQHEITASLVEDVDVIFPVLHGKGGEDGDLQAILETFDVPYVGSGVEASRLCFDKWRYKQFMQSHDLSTPSGELIDESQIQNAKSYHDGFVLKPYDGGSSIDTIIHRSEGVPAEGLTHEIFSRHPQMLLEQLICGTEITVAVLGDTALPVIEIVPPESGEFDYNNKYNGKTAELCPPISVSETLQAQARELAFRAHQLTGCRDFSRTDIMISADNKLYILETNTIPGMTNQSLLPKAAQVAGMDMPMLVKALVGFALQRKS